MTARAKRSRRSPPEAGPTPRPAGRRALDRIRAAAQGADPAEVDFLIHALVDADPVMRRAAAWSLGELREPRARPWLEAMVADPSPEARSIAVEALGRIGRSESRASLEPALADPIPRVREQAAWALWSIGEP
ncbi:MAG TPA: HEAT repeat domain-containing protein, partial [Thermoplasmata archaeon]|nr:HEAT repeat domain-containing protein [Thermoplasmata archaeon]